MWFFYLLYYGRKECRNSLKHLKIDILIRALSPISCAMFYSLLLYAKDKYPLQNYKNPLTTPLKKLTFFFFCSKSDHPVTFQLFVCFVHRLFTPVNTPKGVDFCVHGRFYSCLKGSRAPSSGRLFN